MEFQMTNVTIAQQIEATNAAIDSNDKAAAQAAMDALSARKIPKAKREEVAQLAADVAEMEGALSEAQQMSGQLAKYRGGYVVSVTATGSKSLSNGDDLATYLEAKTWQEVCAIADKHTPIKGGQTHADRYEKLNNGQKRMNAGNKLRAAIKREVLTVEAIAA
jgi:ATP-dependent Clp protease ATP-binding subunit ClpA